MKKPDPDFVALASYYINFIEGDTVLIPEAYALMREYGLVDEEGFWIYGNDVENDS